jgi:hypothetical protein
MSASPESASPSAPAVHPTAGRPRGWRVAVIGLVAVLAVAIGLAAGSFLTARAAVLGSAAAYVPASAAMYVEVRLDPSTSQDAALRDLLGRFPAIEGVDLSRPLFDQLGEVLDETLVDEGADVSWSEDIAPWFDGRVALGLIEMPATAFDPTFDPWATPQSPEMIVLVGVTDAEAARAAFERILDETGPSTVTFTTTEHRGVTIRASEGVAEGAWAVTDDQLLLAPSAEDIVAALDMKAGDASLAGDEEVRGFAAQLPDDWLLFATYDSTAMMAAALSSADSSAAPAVNAFAPLLEHLPMRGAVAVRATDAGLVVEGVGPAPTGPFAVENADRRLADEVPADALYHAEAGNLGAALSAWVTAMKEALATEPDAAEGIATAEAALGADLEELVSWIGDGAMVAGWDGSQPYVGLVLVPDDRQAAQRRLGQLATFAGLAAMDPSSGISVDERAVGGTTITSIRWVDPGMLGMVGGADALVVEYALTDDRVLVGLGDRFVARALELGPADALGAASRYADAFADLGGTRGTGLIWLDIGGIVDAVEQALGAELDDPSYRSDIRPWLTPWDRIIGVAREEDGLVVQQSVLLIR